MRRSRAALPAEAQPPMQVVTAASTRADVPSAADPRPRTLAARLRMQISDEIVRGELAPGVVLDEMEPARRFKVSRTPVREAIRLLGASGLVEERPHRSAVVARPATICLDWSRPCSTGSRPVRRGCIAQMNLLAPRGNITGNLG
jgi:Bacterial regulatory proteins, gntR family